MNDITQIPTNELVHDYLESYMDIARCELDVRLRPSAKVQKRLDINKKIVRRIVKELNDRRDESLFDERWFVLKKFST